MFHHGRITCSRISRLFLQNVSNAILRSRTTSLLCNSRQVLILKRFSASLVKYTAVLDHQVEDALETKQLKHRHHPGLRNVRNIQLPEPLVEAVMTVLNSSEYSTGQLLNDYQGLVTKLWARTLPLEPEEMKSRINQFRHEVIREEDVNLELLTPEEEDHMEAKMKNKVLNKIRKTCNHWKYIDYTKYMSHLYLVGRLASDYAALKQVFSELRHQNPEFSPESLLDFGSGVGSTVWAAHSFWKDSLKEYFCVDVSSDMLALSQLLLQGGKADGDPMVKGLFFRQFLPASNAVKYDLVVSAFSLLDLTSMKERLEVIDSLWQKTQGYLVLIENGTNAGFAALIQARNYLLDVFGIGSQDGENAHVIAPCPHDKVCPRFEDDTKTPCNFEVPYHPLPLSNLKPKQSRFSYLILKKGRRPETLPSWPRIVRPVLCRSRHVVCRMCCSDGHLREIVLTKAKHGRHAYRCARTSEWGDLLPVQVVPKENEAEDGSDEIVE